MSFLFKSSKKGNPGPNPTVPQSLPQVSRDLRSADGKEAGGSQIPLPNGSKPGSPTPPVGSVNNSLNSLSGPEQPVSQSRQADDRIAVAREDNVNARPMSPEQKALRDGSRELVCASYDILLKN